MRFDLNDMVRIKSTGKVGKVKGYRIDGYYIQGVRKEIIQYSVHTGNFYDNFYKEEALESYNSYDFDDKFENGLKKFLIDVYLLHNKLDVVKLLSDSDKA